MFAEDRYNRNGISNYVCNLQIYENYNKENVQGRINEVSSVRR